LALVVVAGFMPVVAAGSEASARNAKTRICGCVCTPEGKPVPGITTGTKERTGWWSRRLERKVTDLLKNQK
jgi:hypothetical protein